MEACKLPLGVIPGGTGNGLARWFLAQQTSLSVFFSVFDLNQLGNRAINYSCPLEQSRSYVIQTQDDPVWKQRVGGGQPGTSGHLADYSLYHKSHGPCLCWACWRKVCHKLFCSAYKERFLFQHLLLFIGWLGFHLRCGHWEWEAEMDGRHQVPLDILPHWEKRSWSTKSGFHCGVPMLLPNWSSTKADYLTFRSWSKLTTAGSLTFRQRDFNQSRE